jgi:hypothetical protein
MNAKRIVWFGLSTLAIASWIASASTSGVRVPAAPFAPIRPTAVDRSMAALQSEMTRLHDRLGPTSTPTRSRDLFRFSAPAPRRRAAVGAPRQPAAVEVAPAAVPAPALALIGIAEDGAAESVVRTAIVSGLGDLFLVKPGEMIRNRYRVGDVSSDAVQLTDTTTDLSITLALR